MMRVRMLIEYDGTDFSGWQAQPGVRTVQGEIEAVLEKLCGRRIAITGSGRTDAGVHALGQVAHADIGFNELERVKTGLPAILPDDIAVTGVIETDPSFHARFQAVSRLYRYRIEKKKNPLKSRYCYIIPPPWKLDTSAMSEASCLSLGENDWKAMAKEGSDNSSWTVNVLEASVTEDISGWTFLIRANRFLRGMVRIWAGTLISIGSGSARPPLVTELLKTQNREKAGVSLPGKGLTLMEVRYN
jgi:tRNA pseudouridine38-40 synthase